MKTYKRVIIQVLITIITVVLTYGVLELVKDISTRNVIEKYEEDISVINAVTPTIATAPTSIPSPTPYVEKYTYELTDEDMAELKPSRWAVVNYLMIGEFSYSIDEFNDYVAMFGITDDTEYLKTLFEEIENWYWKMWDLDFKYGTSVESVYEYVQNNEYSIFEPESFVGEKDGKLFYIVRKPTPNTFVDNWEQCLLITQNEQIIGWSYDTYYMYPANETWSYRDREGHEHILDVYIELSYDIGLPTEINEDYERYQEYKTKYNTILLKFIDWRDAKE